MGCVGMVGLNLLDNRLGVGNAVDGGDVADELRPADREAGFRTLGDGQKRFGHARALWAGGLIDGG
jgi:hypothetical protein